MKRLIPCFVGFLLLIPTVFCQTKSHIELDTYQCAVGDVYKDSPVSVEIGFRNTGTEKLLIYRCTTQCPCMRVSFPKEPVDPGKSGVIVLTYDAHNQHVGEFRKHFTVVTNSATSPHRKVTVRGCVKDGTRQDEPAVETPARKRSFFSKLFGRKG